MGNSECGLALAERVKELFAKKVATTAGIKAYYAIKAKNNKDLEYQTLANICNDNDIDPRCFIDWGFSQYYPKLPQTVKLLCPLVNKYIQLNKPDVEFLRTNTLFENMLDRLNRCKSNDVISFLLDPINEFSCVFVYCAAHQLGVLAKLPKSLLECAQEEIFLKPVYLAKFSDLLPRDLDNDLTTRISKMA